MSDWKSLRPLRDENGDLYIHCSNCNERRYIREGPETECSECGQYYKFGYKVMAPGI